MSLKIGTVLLLGAAVLLMAQQPRQITCKQISEASGLLYSQQYPRVLWTHNDSGDKPYLYALDSHDLTLIARVKITKAKHRDWEDLSYHNGKLVVGDFGNNRSKRSDLKLYIIDEPNPYKQTKAKVVKTVRFHYSDQAGSDRRNYDCEAMFSYNKQLYLLTKHRDDRHTTLYRMEGNVAQKIIDYPIDGKVTGADSDGRYVAVLTYDMLYLLEPTGLGDNMFDGAIHAKHINAGQAEGVALVKRQIYVINEAGELFTYRIDDILKG
ncbi:MAG: hypothetical protein DSZ03_02000 [Sulfurimonas sp.]|nr:MAG: hypothetical protein DSZ03_02000 [Sulfurimonas sp.]